MTKAAQSRETLLIKAFVELADTLVDDYDVIALLDRLAGYCVELLAADAAGILLADSHGNLRVVASTNEQTAWMELLQLQADEGPCVECFRTAKAVSVVDLSEATRRWPRCRSHSSHNTPPSWAVPWCKDGQQDRQRMRA